METTRKQTVQGNVGLTDYERDLIKHNEIMRQVNIVKAGPTVRYTQEPHLTEQSIYNLPKVKKTLQQIRNARMASYKNILENIHNAGLYNYVTKTLHIKLTDGTYFTDRLVSIALMFIAGNEEKLTKLMEGKGRKSIKYYTFEDGLSAAIYSIRRIRGFTIQKEADKSYRKLTEAVELLELQQTERIQHSKAKGKVCITYLADEKSNKFIAREAGEAAQVNKYLYKILDIIREVKIAMRSDVSNRLSKLINKGDYKNFASWFDTLDSPAYTMLKNLHRQYKESFYNLTYKEVAELLYYYFNCIAI